MKTKSVLLLTLFVLVGFVSYSQEENKTFKVKMLNKQDTVSEAKTFVDMKLVDIVKYGDYTNKNELYKLVETGLKYLQKFRDDGLYHSAYEAAQRMIGVVEDKGQLEQLFSKIRELKQLSAQKPETDNRKKANM